MPSGSGCAAEMSGKEEVVYKILSKGTIRKVGGTGARTDDRNAGVLN